ncbi:MAG: hypothetical protein QXD62_01040 [Candidatus Woesearchaeota archaeon]
MIKEYQRKRKEIEVGLKIGEIKNYLKNGDYVNASIKLDEIHKICGKYCLGMFSELKDLASEIIRWEISQAERSYFEHNNAERAILELKLAEMKAREYKIRLPESVYIFKNMINQKKNFLSETKFSEY